MDLIKGGFRTITGIIAKTHPADYRVNTPVATIGVRGTDYAVYIENGELFVGYYKGSPCVTSANQMLCLGSAKPYAKVHAANVAPVPLSQQPDVFREKTTITNVTFSNVTSTASGSNVTPPLSPNNMTPSNDVNGVLSGFCIQ